ncbi:MAG: AraC family transcriptional regulator [Actinomycetales bacterium]
MTDRVRAWHPGVAGVREVLHATFAEHAYPVHTHDAWTVLLVDRGAVRYSLDRAHHHAEPATLTLLPPQVPHDGRSAFPGKAFHKRVVYLEDGWLPAAAVDAATRTPTLTDLRAVEATWRIHAALESPGDVLAVESGLVELRELVLSHLVGERDTTPDAPLARRLRELLDDRLAETVTLADAGRALSAHPSHLVRVFSAAYGISPHRYVIGRRVDRARRLLLGGHSPAQAAVEAGFHDQAHLTRHFRKVLGTTPGTFAA